MCSEEESVVLMAGRSPFSVPPEKVPKLASEDWILIFIWDGKDEQKKDAVAITNQVFCFLQEFLPSLASDFHFKSSGHGPFSEKVKETADKLLDGGLLECSPGTVQPVYGLTEKGKKRAEALFKKLPKEVVEGLNFMHFLARSMGPVGVLQYIHSVHPEYVHLKEGGGAVA
ncbi:MAG: hypothetical protein JSW28_09120 [Thermoplasmata archaeon]|nr:MAG: hypothetical protein JSW28_09120 [Thermoplasmata archaeon]